MRIYVLIFNARTENEGIHTLQDKSSGRNKVLMFESEDDATRFALHLEAQDFPEATVEAMDAEDIKEFCRSANYEWELVAEGKLELPPEANVETTDWQPDGQHQQRPPQQHPQPLTADAAEMSAEELDRIRRQLEGLL
ncbi:MAG: DUF3110 domain-containing protein [Coleofasciculaceae cyanobacterium SM2_3_26]|nr:DUF3110 domain-containing protein [Coleofasciculaceae cyanobacterium SM2_3_26]